jgi:hypothetical protein
VGVHIHIESSKFYDYELHPEPQKVTEDDERAGLALKGHDGKWRRRATFAFAPGADRSSTIVISNDQLKALEDYCRIKGVAMSRNQMVAEHVAKNVMPRILHPEHIEVLQVHGDPALEKFLNTYFEVGVNK